MKLENLIKPFAGDQCLLCGKHPAVIGIFVPDDPRLYGAPAGKSRYVRYCLCDKCKAQADTQEKVEKVIFSDLHGGGVTHE
jgi:hypothetical protein